MSQGITSRKKSTGNSLLLTDVLPLTISIVLIIANITVMAIFYKNRKEPAFDKRKIKLTLLVCLLLNIPLLITSIGAMTDTPPIPPPDTHPDTLQDSPRHTLQNIIFDVITQITVLYCLFLTVLRSWNLVYAYQIGHFDFDDTGTNFWINNYYRLGTQPFPKYYCTISFLIISVPAVFLSVYSTDNAFSYIYVMYGIYLVCSAVIVQLLKHINMQDQLNLAKEIKLYSVISILCSIFMVIILIIIMPTSPLLARILIAVNVFILSISFILYPIHKYHKITSTTQAKQLAEFLDSSETKDKTDETETDNPTLKQFISKNKKCYDHFKSHLQQSWAVENLLFFAGAQLFRSNYNEFDNPEKNSVLRIRFDYLPKTDTEDLSSSDKIESESTKTEREEIENKWMFIYNRYLASNGLYQVNIESDEFENMEQFKQKILNQNKIEENEYYESFESALLQVWALMEGLYVYFRLRNDYKRIIAYSYHEKQNSEAEMETVVERIEDFFDDL